LRSARYCMSHESSWDDVRIASYGPGRYIGRRQSLPRHATMRSEARRVSTSIDCCPRKHYSTTHAWAGRVWQGPLFRRASSSERLTASYLTRPWSLRLELTSWLEARSASTPCPLLLAGVHIAVASTGCVSPRAGRRSSDWHVSSRGQVSIAQDGVSRGRCHCPAQVHVGVDVCALRYM
jgi:hypothetical protein